MTRLLAIVPAFNEGGAIASTVADIREHAPDFDVLVVDDGSSDATAELAAAAGARVIRHPFNLGIAERCSPATSTRLTTAIRSRCRSTATASTTRAASTTCSSTCGPPGLDMVTGSRFLEDHEDGFRSSMPRRLGIRIFAWILSRIVGRPVTDPTSGFRMCGPRGVALFANDYPHDYPEVEAVLLLQRAPAVRRRDPGEDAPAHVRRVVDPGLAFDHLHGQGAAGDLRRAAPRAGRVPAGADDLIAAGEPGKAS